MLAYFETTGAQQAFSGWQTADIGFSGAPYYIHAPLRGDDKDTEFAFKLCSTASSACEFIAQCWYRQDALEREIGVGFPRFVPPDFLNTVPLVRT
jgi:hypothetical protein